MHVLPGHSPRVVLTFSALQAFSLILWLCVCALIWHQQPVRPNNEYLYCTSDLPRPFPRWVAMPPWIRRSMPWVEVPTGNFSTQLNPLTPKPSSGQASVRSRREGNHIVLHLVGLWWMKEAFLFPVHLLMFVSPYLHCYCYRFICLHLFRVFWISKKTIFFLNTRLTETVWPSVFRYCATRIETRLCGPSHDTYSFSFSLVWLVYELCFML